MVDGCIAQLVEHPTFNRTVAGSIPAAPTRAKKRVHIRMLSRSNSRTKNMHRRGRANGNWGPIIQLVTVSMMLQRQHGECEFYRHVAQLGSASGLGPEGRRFKSYHADHFKPAGYAHCSAVDKLVESAAFQAAALRGIAGSSPVR